MDDQDFYMDELDCEEDLFYWPTVEEQLAEVGMSIRDFI